MSRRRTIKIGRDTYVLVATLNEGQKLSFYGGHMIAVEKMDMRPGGTEFDYDVDSRATRDGRATDITTNRTSLRDEFMEMRVKSNVYGLPISLGNAMAMARGDAPVELSYGELQPQVFTSKITTDPVAWRIDFRRAHYAGLGRKGIRQPAAAQRGKVAAQSTMMANGSARAGTQGTNGGPGQADGSIQAIGVDAVLRLYVREAELTKYRPSSRPFGERDMIFDKLGVFDRLGQMLGISW